MRRIPTAYEYLEAYFDQNTLCTIHLTPGLTSGFVYFFSDGHEVKVGFTKHVQRRESSLRTARPRGWMQTWFATTPDMEQRLHALLEPHRIAREWFEHEGELEECMALVAEQVEIDEQEILDEDRIALEMRR